MSFARPTLHFSVQRKQAALAANFGPLLAAAGKCEGCSFVGQVDSTLAYQLC